MASPVKGKAGERNEEWEESLPKELLHLKNSPIQWTAFLEFVRNVKETWSTESPNLGSVVKGEIREIRTQVKEIAELLNKVTNVHHSESHPERLGGVGV